MPNPARTRHPLTIFLKSAGKGFRDMLKPSFRREKRAKGKKEGGGVQIISTIAFMSLQYHCSGSFVMSYCKF